jgi:hypothetical protein
MQNTSDQLQMFEDETFSDQILSLSEALAKTLALLENVPGWKEKEVFLLLKQYGLSQNADQVFLSGKMLKECSPQTVAQTFGQHSLPLPTLGVIDLNGNCSIQAGFYPKIVSGYTLSDILQDEVSQEYFLSEKSISGLMKGQQKPQLLDACQRGGHSGGMHSRMTLINEPKVLGNIYPSGGENGDIMDVNGISKTLKSGETSTKGNGGIGSNNAPKIAVPPPQTINNNMSVNADGNITAIDAHYFKGHGRRNGKHRAYINLSNENQPTQPVN